MSVEIMLSPYDLRLRLFISLKCLFCWQTRRSVFGVVELEVFSKTLQFCFDLFAYRAQHDLAKSINLGILDVRLAFGQWLPALRAQVRSERNLRMVAIWAFDGYWGAFHGIN
jgi:hypothetical protein